MTATSYPLSGANFSTGQWRDVFGGTDGIIDCDGTSETDGRLTLSSVDDTATIAACRVKHRGYILDIDPSESFELAAVTSATTYAVGAMFDPASEATAPLALYAADKTAIVIPSSGSYLPLYEVTRQPSQTLNLATVKDLRRFVGPSIVVAKGVLPDDAPVGARLWDGVDEYYRVRNQAGTGAEWASLTKPTWQTLTLPSSVVADGTAPAICKVSGVVYFRGAWKKADGSKFLQAGGGDGWYSLGTVPAGYRPSSNVSFSVDHAFDTSAVNARVEVRTDGTVRGQTQGDTSRIRSENVRYPAEG